MSLSSLELLFVFVTETSCCLEAQLHPPYLAQLICLWDTSLVFRITSLPSLHHLWSDLRPCTVFTSAWMLLVLSPCLQIRHLTSTDPPSARPINHCPYMPVTNLSSFPQSITTFISWATKARNLDIIPLFWLLFSVLSCIYNHKVLKISTYCYPPKIPFFSMCFSYII